MKKFAVYSLQFIVVAAVAATANASTLVVENLHADEIRTREISYAQPLPDEGVLYFSFETDTGATVFDMSGNGYNGTATQCVWTNEGRFAGGALWFNGGWYDSQWYGEAASRVAVPNAPDFPAWEAYTVSVWFKHDGGGYTGPSYGHKIVDKTSFYHDWGMSLSPQPSSYVGAIGFGMYEGGASSGFWDESHDYRDNQWHHIVIVRNGTLGQYWMDGVLKESNNTMFSVYSYSPLCIGNSLSDDYYQQTGWSGLIDEVRIYDRALSSDEVQFLYLDGALPTPEPEPEIITVSAPLSVSGDMTVQGNAAFLGGIRYVAPLGDLSSGSYTNSASWQ